MLQTIINSFKPKDFYDLQTLLEVNGYSELEAKFICDLIDSKGRQPLEVRKTFGKIINRKKATADEYRLICKSIPFAFNHMHFELNADLFDADMLYFDIVSRLKSIETSN